jgi:dipeptidyl aminopeptidase/acylaminoacyl peptidase
MRVHRLFWLLVPVSTLAWQWGAMAEAPLIPRELLFGNPQRYASVISPDAKFLSWIAPYNGVMNIWIAPLGHLDQARPLTRETGHGISTFASHVTWSYDSKHILYAQDHNGDANTHIYEIDIRDPEARDLTSSDDVRAAIAGVSSAVPDEAVISISRKSVQYDDLYKVDLRNGGQTLLLKNAGYLSFLLDSHLVPRFAVRREPSNDESVVRLSDGGSLMTIPAGDVRTTRLVSISANGKALYLLDSRGRNTTALARLELSTGAETILGEDPHADVQDVTLDDRTREPMFYSINVAHSENRAVNSRVKPDLAALARQKAGDWFFNSQSRDGGIWKLSVVSSGNLSAYLYDRKKRRLSKLYDTRPALAKVALSDMQAVTIQSRAGQDLVSYLSLPPGSDSARKGIPDTSLPLVLVVHGGPHDRNSFGFDPVHQWLANRGYAVLSVNMRGSTGFGKAFLNASVGEWGTNLDDDLSDAVAWAVRNKIADPARIAIMGGSYGGYAVLRGMTRNPQLYACGVDEFGPSDLLTMQSSTTTYGVSALNHNEVGDPSTPEGQAKMKDQSPLTHAAEMRSPLLVAQGANDPAVKPYQSEKMVAAVKAVGVPVTYLFYPDEGHGFVRAENNLSFAGVAERFLAGCLGGRFEPLTAGEIKASSVEVREGADRIPGLDTLLAAGLAKPSSQLPQ